MLILDFKNTRDLMVALRLVRSAFKNLRERGLKDGRLGVEADAVLATEASQVTALLENIRKAANNADGHVRLSRTTLKSMSRFGVTYVADVRDSLLTTKELAPVRAFEPKRKGKVVCSLLHGRKVSKRAGKQL